MILIHKDNIVKFFESQPDFQCKAQKTDFRSSFENSNHPPELPFLFFTT